MSKKLWVPLVQNDQDVLAATMLYVKSLRIYEFISLNNDGTITVKDRAGKFVIILSPVPTKIITIPK